MHSAHMAHAARPCHMHACSGLIQMHGTLHTLSVARRFECFFTKTLCGHCRARMRGCCADGIVRPSRSRQRVPSGTHDLRRGLSAWCVVQLAQHTLKQRVGRPIAAALHATPSMCPCTYRRCASIAWKLALASACAAVKLPERDGMFSACNQLHHCAEPGSRRAPWPARSSAARLGSAMAAQVTGCREAAHVRISASALKHPKEVQH